MTMNSYVMKNGASMKILHEYSGFNTKAAEAIVPFIIQTFNPESVIDVGCGIGTWLYIYKTYGVKNILGIDGHHVNENDLLIQKDEFKAVDLENVNSDDFKNFDLVNCLEVAEHISQQRADSFVTFLTSLSDVIVFSSAIPGQFGQNHKNEQYPDYWETKFNKIGYVYLDPFRKMFWNNPNIDWWYRQNLFLVLKENLADKINIERWDGSFWVAPEIFKFYVDELGTKNKEALWQGTKFHLNCDAYFNNISISSILKDRLMKLLLKRFSKHCRYEK